MPFGFARTYEPIAMYAEPPMPDILSPTKRSQLMARVRQKSTAPELAVRSALHRLGLRFTVNGPLNKYLPGRPDIVLPRHRLVVFVHGCFWHRHPGCLKTTTPVARAKFWTAKFNANVARDSKAIKRLRSLGWRSFVIWECETEEDLESLLRRLNDKWFRIRRDFRRRCE